MKLTDNVHILKWVDEMAALTKPDEIVWIDGSEEQLEKLLNDPKTRLIDRIAARNELFSLEQAES